MKHYDYSQWYLYKKKELPKEKYNQMENHLYECNQCMDIFLSLIDEEEIAKAENNISHDFTNKVMNKIAYINKSKISVKKKDTTKFKNIFLYYAAAAAVAIILTGNGFYKGLVDTVPKMTQVSTQNEKINATNIIFNFSEKIVGKTSSFITNFETHTNKEESR